MSSAIAELRELGGFPEFVDLARSADLLVDDFGQRVRHVATYHRREDQLSSHPLVGSRIILRILVLLRRAAGFARNYIHIHKHLRFAFRVWTLPSSFLEQSATRSASRRSTSSRVTNVASCFDDAVDNGRSIGLVTRVATGGTRLRGKRVSSSNCVKAGFKISISGRARRNDELSSVSP